MSYQSPIEGYINTVTEHIGAKINSNLEAAVTAAVNTSIGINVDRDELLKALAYDRGQYDAGFRDGMAAAVVPVIITNSRGETSEGYFDKNRCLLYLWPFTCEFANTMGLKWQEVTE